MKKLGLILIAACSLAEATEHPIGYGDECPSKGTLDLVADAAAWADSCFSRTTGRRPEESEGESDRQFRDMDLDGTEELLEIRGTGNRSKAIYVFRNTADGFVYLGTLHANPAFEIERTDDSEIEYTYTHLQGLKDGVVKTIRYINNEFVTVSEESVSR